MTADVHRILQTLCARGSRAHTIAAVSTLCLAVAAVVVVGQIAYAMLGAPLPFDQPAHVVRVFERHDARGLPTYAVSTPNFRSWQEQAQVFAQLAAIRAGSANLGADGDREAQRVVAYGATPNLWLALGQTLRAGRSFSDDELRSGDVLVIAEGLAQQRFGSAQAALGQRLRIDGQQRTVVGVAPQDFGFAADVALWLPLPEDETTHARGDRRLAVIGRLAEGIDVAAADARMRSVAVQLARQFPDANDGWSAGVVGARDWLVDASLRERLQLLLAAVALMLLVACANIAGLQVARASARTREYAVRHALGAARGRLLRHALSESLLIAALGVGSGLLVGGFGLQAAAHWLPASMPRVAAIDFAAPVAIGVALVVTAVALLFALLPAVQAARTGVASNLARSARGSSATPRYRRALVVLQFTLATALVVAAIALAQQFAALSRKPLGFDPRGVLVARLTLPAVRDDAQHARSLALFDALMAETRGLPGVSAVGITSEVPMGELDTGMELATDPAALSDPARTLQASWRIVSAGYLEALHVPLLRGRMFAVDGEPADSILLSATLAAWLWPDGDAVGRQVVLGNRREATVVGVVADVRQLGRLQPDTPTMYLPTSWYVWPTMSLVVRSDGDPQSLIAPLRAIAAQRAPDYPLFDIAPLMEMAATDLAAPRLQSGVFALFAIASLLLAAVGVAGVVGQLVVQRGPELALRVAIGAAPTALARRVLGDGLALCALGMLLGVPLALLLAPLASGSASVVAAESMPSVALAVVLLLIAAALAAWIPARRVLAVDPATALRNE
jgi:putative ABC transport system permease protein